MPSRVFRKRGPETHRWCRVKEIGRSLGIPMLWSGSLWTPFPNRRGVIAAGGMHSLVRDTDLPFTFPSILDQDSPIGIAEYAFTERSVNSAGFLEADVEPT